MHPAKAKLRRHLSRHELVALFNKLLPCLVGMEACFSAHHWARALVRLGHTVRLIPPQYFKPYVKRNKTDAADAEAFCEAIARPNMRFVPIKTVEQQGILALHRVRSLLVRQRKAAVNAARGLLAEFGVVAGKGIQRVDELRRRMASLNAELFPDEARTAFASLFAHFDALYEQVATIDARILAWHRGNAESQRLASAPGMGLMTAQVHARRRCLGRVPGFSGVGLDPCPNAGATVRFVAGDDNLIARIKFNSHGRWVQRRGGRADPDPPTPTAKRHA